MSTPPVNPSGRACTRALNHRRPASRSFFASLTLAALILSTPLLASQQAQSINLGQTTIQFSTPVTYVTHPDGGVTVDLGSNPVLTSISTATVDRGGAVWKPYGGEAGYTGKVEQGWDALWWRKDETLNYNPALNMAPEATGASFVPPGEGALVIGIPNPSPGVDYRDQISNRPNEYYRVVNFMNQLPPAGSYRAPGKGPTEVRASWNQATVAQNLDIYFPHDMDLSALQPRSEALALLARAKAESATGTSWTTWGNDSSPANQGWNTYGRDWCQEFGNALLALRNTELTATERAEMADAIVQIGIYLYGLVRDGAYWQMNGGWTHGRIWAVDIAGLLVGDDYIRNMANDPLNSPVAPGEMLTIYPFTEQRQFIPITAELRTVGTNPAVSDQVADWGIVPGREDNTRTNEPVPVGPQEIGMSLWSVANDRGWHSDSMAIDIGRAGGYHQVNITSQLRPRLAYDYLEAAGHGALFAGTKHIRDGIDAGLQDWLDYDNRRDEIAAQGFKGGGMNYLTNGAAGYFNRLDPARIFDSRPTRAYPPILTATESQFWVELNAMEPSMGNPITRRDLRWRTNDGAWTEIQDISSSSLVFPHNGVIGEVLEVQIRLHNQKGFGSWSYSTVQNNIEFGTVLIEADDTEAPSVPANVQATLVEATTVTLSWDPSTDNRDVAAYDIYVDGVYNQSVTETTAVVADLLPSTSYLITVTAIDPFPFENESAPSVPLEVSTAEGNLALFGSISDVSSHGGGRVGSSVIDGVNDVQNNYWSARHYPQWIEIDLGQECNLSELKVFTRYSRAYQYKVFARSEGGDYDFNNPVVDRSNNSEPGNPITDSLAGTTAQFLRLDFTGASDYTGSYTQIIEIEVYGSYGSGGADTTAPDAPTILQSSLTGNSVDLLWDIPNDNVGVTEYQLYLDGVAYGNRVSLNSATVSGLAPDSAYILTVSAFDAAGNESAQSEPVLVSTQNLAALYGSISAVSGQAGGHKATKLIDGINNGQHNRWSVQHYPQWVEIDLGQDCDLSELKVYTYQSRAYQYTVQAKVDGGSYAVVVDRSSNTEPGNPISDSLAGVTARYLRLDFTGASDYTGNYVQILEVEIYGANGVGMGGGGAAPATAEPTYSSMVDVIIGNDIESYTNQDKNGDTIIAPDGSAVTMTGNNWKRVPLDPAYVVTPNTVLEVTINAADTGEIIGIGFEDNGNIGDQLRVFQLGGSANWGDGIPVSQPYEGTDNGNDVSFSIHVGQYYTGSMDWLVFVADDDADSSTDVTFSNIQICEIDPDA